MGFKNSVKIDRMDLKDDPFKINLPEKKIVRGEFDHLIVTRANMNWGGRGYDAAQMKRRIELMDKTTRPSIQQQTNKNFKFITLWNEMPTHKGIDGEIMEVVKNDFVLNETFTHMPVQYNPEITKICKKYITKDFVLVTKLDNDDCLGANFVEILQQNVNLNNFPFYYDVRAVRFYRFNTQKKEIGRLPHTSMFLSVLEKSSDFVCYPYNYKHPQIGQVLRGKHIVELDALFTQHADNSDANMIAYNTKFDLKHYSPRL